MSRFRLSAEKSRRGAGARIAFASLNCSHSLAAATAGGDPVAPCRGNRIWLDPEPSAKLCLLCPTSATIPGKGSCVLIRLEKASLALGLIKGDNTSLEGPIANRQSTQEEHKRETRENP